MDTELTRIDPARNSFRFYRLALWPDLFGGCALAREWGRIGQPGTLRLEPYADAQEAGRALTRLAAAKQRRGYRPGPQDAS